MEKIVFLLVDDCPGTRTILRGLVSDYLKDHNIPGKTLLAKNGKDALGYFNESAIDVLITDLKMPVISGESLIREVEVLSPSTFSVLMTGTSGYTVPQDFSFSVGFLEKPFDEETLAVVLGKILDNFA